MMIIQHTKNGNGIVTIEKGQRLLIQSEKETIIYTVDSQGYLVKMQVD